MYVPNTGIQRIITRATKHCVAFQHTSLITSPYPRLWAHHLYMTDTIRSTPSYIKHECPVIPTINTLRPRKNGRHFADDIFKCIFLNENDWIPIKISLKFVPLGPINNIQALVQIMAWCRPGDKPLSWPMMVRLPTHIYVTRPQWVNCLQSNGLDKIGRVSYFSLKYIFVLRNKLLYMYVLFPKIDLQYHFTLNT